MRQENPIAGPPVRREEMLKWIEEICAFGIRRPGYPANRAAEKYIAQKFHEFGIPEIAEEPVPTHCWTPVQTALSLGPSKTEIPCAGIPYTAWTGEEGVEAELVFVGEGGLETLEGLDLRGKIAVFEARFGDLSAAMMKQGAIEVFDPGGNIPDGIIHKANWLIMNFAVYYELQVRGADAAVGLLVDSPIDGCSYYVPYDGYLKDLPAIWVGRDRAGEVREAARAGASARLVSQGETPQVNTHNIVGVLPGRTDEAILLTSHHDGPFASAVEDGSGISLLLALAKRFGANPGLLDRTLLFVAASGHFHGGIGNRVYVEAHKEDWIPKTVAALGMEHIAHEAEEDGQGGYRLTGRAEVRAFFTDGGGPLADAIVEGVRKWGIDRTMVVPPYLFGPEPPCDAAPYFTAGIPSACLISGPLYLFDEFDTIDKVRAEDLENVVAFYEELILKLDGLSRKELERGVTRKRTDPPAPPAHWFLPPSVILEAIRKREEAKKLG